MSDSTAYMLREIAHICRELGPRAPGSAGERRAAEYLAGLLERDCGCAARIEPFRERLGAFYGYFFFSAVLDVLCCLGFFLRPWLSILFGGAALLLFLLEFGLYRQIIDPLFPLAESVNVTAVRPCAGPVRRRVLLNGHLDAAREFPLNYLWGGVVFEIPGVMAVLGVLLYIALGLCALLDAGQWVYRAAPWGLLFLPFFLLVAFTFHPRRIVDGANDDLTGCLMAVALLRELERTGTVPENTEVGVVLTGAEEAGLRGAKAWCRAHREDFRDVPTCILTFDTIHDPALLMVNERDLNGTVAADPALGEAFLRAAREAGVPCRRGWVPPMGGATDSAAFTQGGFASVGITGLSHRLEKYYHTRLDTAENLDPAGLENCFRAAMGTIRLSGSGALEQAARRTERKKRQK